MLQVSIALITDEPHALPSFVVVIIEDVAKDGQGEKDGKAGSNLPAATLVAQLLARFDELAARLISAELELISIRQLDIFRRRRRARGLGSARCC